MNEFASFEGDPDGICRPIVEMGSVGPILDPDPFGAGTDGIGRFQTSWVASSVPSEVFDGDYGHLVGPCPTIAPSRSTPDSE